MRILVGVSSIIIAIILLILSLVLWKYVEKGEKKNELQRKTDSEII